MTAGDLVGEFVLPLPVARRFAFVIPSHMAAAAAPGKRALLPSAGRGAVGFYVGPAPAGGLAAAGERLREIRCFVDEAPLFPPAMMELLFAAARYYHFPEGLVFQAAAGPQEKALGRVRYVATGEALARAEEGRLGELERRVVVLAGGSAKTEVQLRRHVPLLSREKLDQMLAAGLLAQKEAVRLAERRVDEKLCLYVGERGGGEEAPEGLTDAQREVLDALRRRDGVTLGALRRSLPVRAQDVRALRSGGFVRVVEIEGPRQAAGEGGAPAVAGGGDDGAPATLSGPQREACAALDGALEKGGFAPFLLFGVTGSGKTEVYLRAIVKALSMGRSAVVIVPEIALTPQLMDTFRRRIGEQVAVIHSGLTTLQRRREMAGIADGRRRVVVGARSALFSLVRGPAVFVVDEEHDASLKQGEGLRYSARDMALLRARGEGAVAVLSSATPSIESFHNALAGRYTLLTLPDRVSPYPLPRVEVVNLRRDICGPRRQTMITMPLYRAIGDTLAAGGQVIIFLNRRGYAPVSSCRACGEPLRCPDCSISLTYHDFTSRLSCHSCGRSVPMTSACPSCGGADTVETRGPGTEKLETVVRSLFPHARVVRLDSDVASGVACEPILRKLRDGEADILVGTQMITKGHDLPRVALVGVVRADAELGFPDFRAAERTFSTLTQVAGRAGRGDLPGRVVLQAFSPEHPVIEAAVRQNYTRFYQWETRNRKRLFYPPYSYLALVRVEGGDEAAVDAAAGAVRAELDRAADGAPAGSVQVLGPAPSPIARVRRRHRRQVLVKAGTRALLSRLADAVVGMKRTAGRDVRVILDIDPVDFM